MAQQQNDLSAQQEFIEENDLENEEKMEMNKEEEEVGDFSGKTKSFIYLSFICFLLRILIV